MSRRIETSGWERVAQDAMSGMAAWREEHPQASLAEIERETDRRLAELRARMIQDVAQASELAEMGAGVARPVCATCGCELSKNGQQTRHLTTREEQTIRLERTHLRCPQCGAGFFPPG